MFGLYQRAGSESGSVIQLKIHGRNFKMKGHMTSLIACMDSSTVIKKNLTNLSTFDIPSYKQCALNACALVRSQLPKECTFWTLEIMGLNYVEL